MSQKNETKVLIMSLLVSGSILSWGYWLSLNQVGLDNIGIGQKNPFENLQNHTSISRDEVPRQTGSPSIKSQEKFVEVRLDKLKTYTHPGGIFSMDVPEGWTKQDSSKLDEVIIAWTDPALNALIIVDIFETETTWKQDILSRKLNEFILGLFSKEPMFAISSPKEQFDRTMRVEWSYEVNVQGRTGTLLGNSFIEQKGNKIIVFSVAVPKEQFDELKDSMNRIIASRKIDPSVKIAK